MEKPGAWRTRAPGEATPPEEAALGEAQAALLRAIDETRRAGERYFSAPLNLSEPARDDYYDALRRQWEAERAFYEAKGQLSRTGHGGPASPHPDVTRAW